MTITKNRLCVLLIAVMPLTAAACEDVETAPAKRRPTDNQASQSPSQKRLAACEAAFRKEYRKALDEGSDGRRPPECKGVSRSSLHKIVVKVIQEETPTLPTRSASQP